MRRVGETLELGKEHSDNVSDFHFCEYANARCHYCGKLLLELYRFGRHTGKPYYTFAYFAGLIRFQYSYSTRMSFYFCLHLSIFNKNKNNKC